MTGVYLSLMFGTGDFKSKYGNNAKDELISQSSVCREKNPEILNTFNETEIDLAINSSSSLASFYEAGNIAAKYYDINNLPTEEELQADYWEMLEIYNKITGTKPDFLGIRDFIQKMLENYLKAKNDKELAKYLNCHFANKGDFQDYLVNIAEKSGNGNYVLHAFFGGANKFIPLPWLIIYKRNSDSPFYIIFQFREDMEGVYLSLTDSYRIAERAMRDEGIDFDKFDEKHVDYIRKRASDARNRLIEFGEIRNDFIKDIDLNSPNAASASSKEAANIYAKYYTLENSPSEEELKNDFIELLDLYKKLDQKIPKIWQISPGSISTGEQDKLWPLFRDKGYIGIGWFHNLRSYLEFDNIDGLKEALIEFYPEVYSEKDPSQAANMVWDFTHTIKKGDIIVANAGYHKARGIGIVTSDYIPPTNPENPGIFDYFWHLRKINWKMVEEIEFDRNIFLQRTLTEINPKKWDEIKNAYIKVNPAYSDVFKEMEGFKNGTVEPQNGDISTGSEKMTFFDFLAQKGYFFDQKLVENFLLSLKIKPFVILTGNSGTGKTKVAQLFAQYLSKSENSKDSSFVTEVKVGQSSKSGGWGLNKADFYEFFPALKQYETTYNIKVDNVQGKGILTPWPYLFFDKTEGNVKKRLEELNSDKKIKLEIILPKNNESKYEIIPVGANWTENRHIIGFYNVITEKYQGTEALDLILSAINDTEEPYFLILDEMNLSHVERYFSDFLSAMESEEEIELHQSANKEENNNEIPPKIKLSQNLMVVGTVNVDETTYMFSPKVLDRANTLEFLTHGAEDYMSSSPNYAVKGNIDYLQNPLSDVDVTKEINIRTENIFELKNRLNGVITGDNQDLWSVLSLNIGKFQDILKEADFDFGFRTINEIIRFMCVAWQYEKQAPKWDNWARYFDAQIVQKMLPKLHGSQKELGTVLEKLEQECTKGNFPTSTDKIKRMRKTLQEKRYVSFTG